VVGAIDLFGGGLALWLNLLLSHLFLGFKEDGIVPSPLIRISLVIHVI
jgi:hypothetical protein